MAKDTSSSVRSSSQASRTHWPRLHDRRWGWLCLALLRILDSWFLHSSRVYSELQPTWCGRQYPAPRRPRHGSMAVNFGQKSHAGRQMYNKTCGCIILFSKHAPETQSITRHSKAPCVSPLSHQPPSLEHALSAFAPCWPSQRLHPSHRAPKPTAAAARVDPQHAVGLPRHGPHGIATIYII